MRFLIIFALFFLTVPAHAQLSVPPKLEDVPALKLFIEDTQADIEYVSRQYGVDMWVATKDGVPQIIYTTPDGRGMLMNGFLFAPDGTMVTEQSFRDYAEDAESIVREKAIQLTKANAPKTPGEKLWLTLEGAEYVDFGSRSAPRIYSFVDPYCPHCKLLWGNFRPYVEAGKVNIRLIPVGILGEQSVQAAGYMITQSDRQQAWFDITQNNVAASVLSESVGLAQAKENLDIMTAWKMDSTPFSVYKDANGKVKMFRGNPENIATLLKELGVVAE